MTKKKCWICGQPADTGEHAIKRKDVAKLFKQPDNSEKIPIYVLKNNRLKPLQGPKSNDLKYPNSLCSECNNSRSKPFDLAYDEFIEWYDAHKKEVEHHRVIDFADVFGSAWPQKQLDLFRYFAKEFGCRLSHQKLPVPNDIIEILTNNPFRTGLYVTFSWSFDLIVWNCAHETIVSSPSTTEKLREDVIGYRCGHTYDCIMMIYHYLSYHPMRDEHLGAPWAGGSRCIYLGWQFEQDEDKKKQLIDNVLSSSKKTKIVAPNL